MSQVQNKVNSKYTLIRGKCVKADNVAASNESPGFTG